MLASTEHAGRSEDVGKDVGTYQGRWTLQRTLQRMLVVTEDAKRLEDVVEDAGGSRGR